MYNLLSRFFKHKPLPKEQLDYIVDEVEKRLSPKIIKDMSLTDANYIGARLSAIAKDFKPVNILQEDLVDITLPPIALSDLPVGETKQPKGFIKSRNTPSDNIFSVVEVGNDLTGARLSELAKLTPDEFNRKLYGYPTVSQQRDSQNVRSRPTPTTSINTTASNTYLDRDNTWYTTPLSSIVDNTPSHSCSHSSSSDYSSSSSSCDSSSSSGGWD